MGVTVGVGAGDTPTVIIGGAAKPAGQSDRIIPAVKGDAVGDAVGAGLAM